jgi:hypothetical protein
MRSTLPSLKFTVVCTCKFTVNTGFKVRVWCGEGC